MRIQKIKFLALVLFLLVTCLTHQKAVYAQETAPPPAEPETGSSMTISDLIASSSELPGRLSALKRNLELGFDVQGFETFLEEAKEHLNALATRLNQMKTDNRLGLERLSALKAETLALARELEENWKPFADRIKQLERWGHEWSQDKQRLLTLGASLPRDESFKTLKPAIDRAMETIDEAGKLLSDDLKSLLATEDKAAAIYDEDDSLANEIESLLQALRGDLFRKSAPFTFSSEYFSQFNIALWEDLKKGLELASASKWGVVERNTLFIVFQIALFLILSVIIIRNRPALAQQPDLHFLAKRPFSAGVIIGVVAFFPFYEAGLGAWRVVDLALAGLCIARLSGCCIAGSWRRRAVYGMVLVLIINESLQVADFPQPLYGLYVLVVALIGLLLCSWRLMKNADLREARLYRWALRGGIVVYGAVIVANVSGYSALGAHLLEASLKSVLLFLLVWILTTSGRGGLEFVFKSPSVNRVPLLQKNAAAIVRISSRLVNLFAGALVAAYLLVWWGFYDSGLEAFRSFLSLGFTIGSWRANVSIILAALLCLYVSLLVSRAVQSILAEAVFPKRGVEKGVQLSMARLVHYAIFLVGFLLALATLGVNFTNITIIGGALGVGIGFGLQAIVNNFVSGLILLFERPVREGDYVEIGGMWAEIKKIGLRSTVVESFDRADIIVPNSDLISNQVTNWTRSNREVRLRVPVGVAYGSDVPLVMKILLECAENNPSVLSSPACQALFRGFGNSSLDFELRVFTPDIDRRLIVFSELLEEIDREFRLNGVEIPFPQRDLHLRSVDEKAGRRLLGKDLGDSSNRCVEELE